MLEGDIENLESFYLDRGYLKYSLESIQVSISQDRKDVFITMSVFEGEKYTIDEVNIIGELPIDETLYEPLLDSLNGQLYSQAQITQIEEYFTDLLGNQAIPVEVRGTPEIQVDNELVDLLFIVQPGKRTYARKINFSGNYLN